MNVKEDPAVTRFREYLRIKSVHPSPDYETCIAFLKAQAEEINLDFQRIELIPGAESVVCMTWKGSKPEKTSIMLNSHMDVVPVDLSKWTHEPFAAEKDSEGNIFARGTQDMKGVGMQYLEAVRRLKAKGFTPERTIHVTFVPDEELGSKKGMALFVETPEFAKLNVGFGLDEAGACPTEHFLVFNAERALWQIRITVKGNTGHALHFIQETAAAKSLKILNAFDQFRNEQIAKLNTLPGGAQLRLGDVHTLNMTMIEGGVQPNVIAPEMKITYDLRVSPEGTEKEIEELIENVCIAAATTTGSDISYEFILKDKLAPKTSLGENNMWWKSFKATCDKMHQKLIVMTCPGATDARFLRQRGIPAFGFMPINNTPVLLHDNDEYVNENVFIRGITFYECILENLSMLD